MSKWSIFALCIIAAVGLWFYNNGACPLQAMSPSSDTASSGSYQPITASQVKERLDKGDKITVKVIKLLLLMFAPLTNMQPGIFPAVF